MIYLKWCDIQTKWRFNITSISYLIIFLSGILFAASIYFIINYGPKSLSTIKYHHLPESNYLQLRDEFPILSSFKANFYPTPIDSDDSSNIVLKSDDNTANEQEALGSLHMALEMDTQGKDGKAFRLYQHAIALAPKHPEILTKYGEYLEHRRQDVVKADQFYFQALSVNPLHSRALANRQRTATIVENLDLRRLLQLDEKRDALSEISEANSALRRAKKEAYVQHIYHSVGIEGNTMSLAQTRSILETRMAVDGKSIDEHNEIIGLDTAMKYINATLVNKSGFITLKDILEIHRRVLGHVDPIEGGELRRTQVYVGGHIPPGPGDLGVLMQRFEHWLNSDVALSMHPVKYGALAHYKLVHIHPFTDGNGRTSRLLMNTILMRFGYPPVIIPKQQRHNYYDYLQLANEGDIRPFIRFIADCTEKTLDLYLWATSDLAKQIPLLAQNDEHTNSPLNSFDDSEFGSGDTIRIKSNYP